MTGEKHELFWDATYAIVMALMEGHPDRTPDNIGLLELSELVQSLSGFNDDPGLATERILLDIQTVWYEEILSL